MQISVDNKIIFLIFSLYYFILDIIIYYLLRYANVLPCRWIRNWRVNEMTVT